jgi:1-deoxy-D-xylulose-5-phosphate reductoisomerase
LFEIGALHFKKPDFDAFPCLRLAVEAAVRGGNRCAVVNGANEAAFAAFLAGKIPFGRIGACIETALSRVPYSEIHSVDDVLDADAQARAAAGF